MLATAKVNSGCEDGRRGEDDGDGEGEIVGIKRKEGERFCEIVNPKTGEVVACAKNGELEDAEERAAVSSYATLRDDCNRESRETGFTTVSRCAR